ncbi:hypothetical protein CVD28_08715 [Bacillus sp. M6-12]|uniref:helix-turn-helix domain-containing protein n=1 Tax=Bacillus sp. M6-12 TaxID=2054166 RepID=UPI000C76B899|nr:helix-turn-helix domain-containing protein [Bacillus sp. M6-12]PLS17774.1 hypothetical protein CVD28_08715 [Bacillus sp. M6-12]
MGLSEKLRALRKEREWKQRYVAGKMNLSRSTISKFETGKQIPEVEVLLRFAELFHVDPDYLISELTGMNISNEKRTPYIFNKASENDHIILEMVKTNPRLHKLLLQLDQFPVKEQQKAIEMLEIFLKGLNKR